MNQIILTASEHYSELDEYFKKLGCRTIFLVCGKSFNSLRLNTYFKGIKERLGIEIIKFDDFKPNPSYESVENGVASFNKTKCDVIVAVGGGSSIDVAKCIKLYSNMNPHESYLKQPVIPNNIPFLAVPTTAGSGSEATKYVVIYCNGEKQSVAHESCIPSAVLFDSSVLKTLPEYQRKSTILDALCHSIESFWSVNSTDESKQYSTEAMKIILDNLSDYLKNMDSANTNMLKASNLAGKAINITQTTAGHALCYKLTSLYGISHGHAAALCVNKLWPFMLQNTNNCIDSRGREYLNSMFADLAKAMNCKKAEDAAHKFTLLLNEFSLQIPVVESDRDFEVLRKSVNIVRLKNNPVKLTEDDIDKLYHQILEK